MKVSTRGRYALRVMLDLAQHRGEGPILLMDIARRQEISEKYLEGIMAALSKRGLVTAQRGRGGGYQLNCPPQAYTVGSVLKCTEGSLAPVACLEGERNLCSRADQCLTLPMWQKLDRLIDDYLESVTLADLLTGAAGADNYVI